MSILERQFLTPTHVAWPLRLSQEANEPWEIGACLLWAAHRCMRLRLALAYGFDDPRSTKGRFQDLLDAMPEASEVERRLVAEAGAFLEPTALCRRTDRETLPLVNEIAHLVSEMQAGTNCLYLGTTSPAMPQRVFVWRGPGGHGTGPGTLESQGPGTWLGLNDNQPTLMGPATQDAIPLPLLPCPAPAGRRWFECPRGILHDDRGQPATLHKIPSPGHVLGRLLAWALTRGKDGTDLAGRLADAGMRNAGAELWISATAMGLPGFTPQTVSDARAFFEQHRIDQHGANLDDWLVQEMDRSEKLLSTSGEFKGLSDLLLARLQIDKGPERQRTLVQLAHLFKDKLGDIDSAIWCLLSNLEDNPQDDGALADLVELLGQTSNAQEPASRLLGLASATQGATKSRLALVAAEAWRIAKSPDEELASLVIALEGDPTDTEIARRAIDAAAQHEETKLHLLALVRDGAKTLEQRARASAQRAKLLAQKGLTKEAKDEWKNGLSLDPEHLGAFDALVDQLIAEGKSQEAVAVAQDLAGRLATPQARAHVLGRLATMESLAPDRAEVIMTEALALQPGQPELARALGEIHARRGAWQAHLAALGRLAMAAPDREAEILLQMADVAADKMDDPLAALAFLTTAQNKDPGNNAPRLRAEALRERLGLWAEVARDLENHARDGGPQSLAALLRLADVYLDRLSLRERAKETLWSALDIAPGEAAGDIAQRLAAMHHEDLQRDRELLALGVATKVCEDDDQRAEMFVTMGQRALEAPADKKAGRQHLEEALKLNPVHPVAVTLACELWLEAGHPEKVIAVIEPLAQEAARVGDVAQELKVRRMAAQAASQCNDEKQAYAQWSRVAELAPGDLPAAANLGRLLAAQGRYSEALDALIPCLDGPCDDKESLLRIAADSAMKANQPARALVRVGIIIHETGWRRG